DRIRGRRIGSRTTGPRGESRASRRVAARTRATMKLVTADQMRLIEQRAIEAGVSIAELMEAAGLAVAQEAWLALGLTPGRRVLVLVGAGNNGGDRLVAARHLAERG